MVLFLTIYNNQPTQGAEKRKLVSILVLVDHAHK